MGENATVILGVVNREGEDATYRIAVVVDGEDSDSIDGLVLEDGDKWEDRVAIVPANAGEDQKVEFLLYRDGGREPYRSLHLFLDVGVAVVGAVQPPDGTSSPTPSPNPTSEPAESSPDTMPPGFTHVVQPEDTLATLSEHFGLTPEIIATANGMDESDSLPAGEELLIPGAVYTVQPGDSLLDIADAFDIPLDVILTVNAIGDSRAIVPSQELMIPGD